MSELHSSKRVVSFLFGLWRISPRLSRLMIVTQVLFSILTTTVAPIFVSQLLTHIANGSAAIATSTGLLAGYAVILFFGDVVSVRLTIAMAYVSESKMQATVTGRVLRHLTSKSLGYHSNRMSGGIVSDSGKLNGSIERFWDTLIFTAVPIATTIVSVCIVLSFIFWQYAVALAVLSIIIITIIIRAQSAIAPISRQVADRSSAMTAYFADVVSNIATVKAFAREKSELRAYDERVTIWRQTNLKEMKNVLFITGTFGVMMMMMNISAFVAAILATQYHIATIGITYLVISYTLNVVSQLWSVAGTTRAYIRIVGDAGPMIATLDDEVELKDPANPEKLKIKEGLITFDNVTFTHDENEDTLFENFNITIQPGERVGLVGPSGSGKTTLTRLLLRFSDVEEGQILIDGQNISAIAQDDLHSSIAYVSQEPMLFHRTLRENIAYGKADATDAEIRHAAEQANAIEFINKLHDGFETLVGERGVKLSGGQRQRVAIARAILKNAPILVLDEATSALDSESEKLIQDALVKLMKGRTSIVIAHRLSTIAKLDRILLLDNGAITEQGTHSELLKKDGTYARLWNHQSGGFIED